MTKTHLSSGSSIVTQERPSAWQYRRPGSPLFSVVYIDPATGLCTYALVRYTSPDHSVKRLLATLGVDMETDEVLVEYLGFE